MLSLTGHRNAMVGNVTAKAQRERKDFLSFVMLSLIEHRNAMVGNVTAKAQRDRKDFLSFVMLSLTGHRNATIVDFSALKISTCLEKDDTSFLISKLIF